MPFRLFQGPRGSREGKQPLVRGTWSRSRSMEHFPCLMNSAPQGAQSIAVAWGLVWGTPLSVEYGKNTNCSSIVSCGSDACSATNHVPSYGPLGFPVSAQNLFLDKLDHDPGVKGRIPGVCPSVPGYCAQGFLDNPCKFSCVNGADVNSIRTQDGTCTWGDLPLP